DKLPAQTHIDNGSPSALGLPVSVDDYSEAVDALTTAPRSRAQGVGASVTAAIIRWARGAHAKLAYPTYVRLRASSLTAPPVAPRRPRPGPPRAQNNVAVVKAASRLCFHDADG